MYADQRQSLLWRMCCLLACRGLRVAVLFVHRNVRLCNEGSAVYYAPSYRSANMLIAFLRKFASLIRNYPLTPPYLLPKKS